MKIHHTHAHGESLAGETKSCEECGERFKDYHGGRKWCSNECRSASGRTTIPCRNCDEPFELYKSEVGERKYCSWDCHDEDTNERLACEWCGESFNCPQSEADRTRFCSVDCRYSWQGEQFSGQAHPMWNSVELVCPECGDAFMVPACEAENRKHCSKECYVEWQKQRTGADVPNWSGGHEEYYGPGWRRKRLRALRRDQARCQVCGMTDPEHRRSTGRALNVHHITPLREFRSDGEVRYGEANKLDNLLTLCSSCHKKWEKAAPLRPDIVRGVAD